jgi:hypothetical protein
MYSGHDDDDPFSSPKNGGQYPQRDIRSQALHGLSSSIFISHTMAILFFQPSRKQPSLRSQDGSDDIMHGRRIPSAVT